VQPTPAERLAVRLAHLPPDALRLLDGALERAQARARIEGGEVRVTVVYAVREDGLHAVETVARVERRIAG
jgi:hypothetical protein